MRLPATYKFVLFAVLLISAVAIGIAVFEPDVLPAFPVTREPSGPKVSSDRSYDRTAEMTRHAFKDRLLDLQVFPPVESLRQITESLDGMYFPVEHFFDAYENLELGGHERRGNIFQIDYGLVGREFSAYAYTRKATASAAESNCAALIIPGTGHNQSTPIFQRDRENYHGDILRVFEPRCDSYVLVKPNEDFLAIHDGRGKLSYDFVLRYLLNKGGSYSAHYVTNSLALAKYLQRHYERVYVAGLSQGGEAALLNGLQSQPTAVIVASGFSLLSEQIDWAGCSQIVIPGLRGHYSNERILEILKDAKTRFMFTYGKDETGTYGIEAEEGLVCNQFATLPNVDCATHSGGHEFPGESIGRFVQNLESLTGAP